MARPAAGMQTMIIIHDIFGKSGVLLERRRRCLTKLIRHARSFARPHGWEHKWFASELSVLVCTRLKRLMPGFANARNCRVTALSRRDAERAAESAREFGIEHAFTSTAELCASPDVDAVFIATPDALHLADVLEAVRHGKPVLVEKPMAMNAAEARQMVEAARAADVLLGVAHVMRFHESVRWFRERIASGAIGKPVLAQSTFVAPLLESARTWINDPQLGYRRTVGGRRSALPRHSALRAGR